MCYGCWSEYGSPRIDTSAVREALKAVAEVYELHSAGGGLHIVVDDWNIEDDHIAWCQENSIPEISEHHTEDQREVETRCAALMMALTMEERASVLGLEEGHWS